MDTIDAKEMFGSLKSNIAYLREDKGYYLMPYESHRINCHYV